ncbi:unnamed protein product [Oppiella nova]|uniref:mitogen-activated protein kinase kinase n=1 Tax=Oppiella nova TaxID=334625 RepID=A0A7R9QRN9_9ACAR|nr:unnamed protein product [Oppiella nova]CAG2171841.1 unnamed protein product [Oppiella nova]
MCESGLSLGITSDGQVLLWGGHEVLKVESLKEENVFITGISGGLSDKEKRNVLNETQSLVKLRSEDLKPDNVLISKSGRIKLCDFGLAKEVVNCDSFNMSKTKHTADVGSVDYMAPEAQTNDYNHLIDIYSLSLIGAQIFGFETNDVKDGNYH